MSVTYLAATVGSVISKFSVENKWIYYLDKTSWIFLKCDKLQIEAGFIFWSKIRSDTIVLDAQGLCMPPIVSTKHVTDHLLRGLKRRIQPERQLIPYCSLTLLQSTQYLGSNFLFLCIQIEATTGINIIFIIESRGCDLQLKCIQ